MWGCASPFRHEALGHTDWLTLCPKVCVYALPLHGHLFLRCSVWRAKFGARRRAGGTQGRRRKQKLKCILGGLLVVIVSRPCVCFGFAHISTCRGSALCKYRLVSRTLSVAAHSTLWPFWFKGSCVPSPAMCGQAPQHICATRAAVIFAPLRGSIGKALGAMCANMARVSVHPFPGVVCVLAGGAADAPPAIRASRAQCNASRYVLLGASLNGAFAAPVVRGVYIALSISGVDPCGPNCSRDAWVAFLVGYVCAYGPIFFTREQRRVQTIGVPLCPYRTGEQNNVRRAGRFSEQRRAASVR